MPYIRDVRQIVRPYSTVNLVLLNYRSLTEFLAHEHLQYETAIPTLYDIYCANKYIIP